MLHRSPIIRRVKRMMTSLCLSSSIVSRHEVLITKIEKIVTTK